MFHVVDAIGILQVRKLRLKDVNMFKDCCQEEKQVLQTRYGKFPGGSVIRTQCFNCQAPGSISKSCGMMAKKKKKEKRNEKKTERKSREKTKFNFKGHALLYLNIYHG